MENITEAILDSLLDAVIDTAKMVPLLFLVYVLIEVIEIKFGHRMGPAMAKAGKAGPVIGALAGIIPQCGVSVMGTALYTQRFVTIGTLFAIYLATSDEAIPVILAQPEAAGVLVPIIAMKLIVAIVVGYGLDLIFRERNQEVFARAEQDVVVTYGCDCGCCGGEAQVQVADDASLPVATEAPLPNRKLDVQALLVRPLLRTLKIWAFIFVVSFAIALAFELVGEETIAGALEGRTFLQPILAALVGLIPNCAASVAITQFYLDGIITFGATIAGLCASGGLGILVLLEESQGKREALAIIAGLYAISVVAGLACGFAGL